MTIPKGVKIAIVVGAILVGILGVSFAIKNRKAFSTLDPEKEDAALSEKFNFHLIPSGLGNYRSAQMTEDVLPGVIKKYNIKHIIRLNGDGNDSKHKSSFPETPRAVEKKICEDNGCTYHQLDAHKGYQEGRGYVGSLNDALPILAKGNTLVHCAHGADRTGYIVASHLKDTGKMTDKDQLWQYTTQYNSWQRMINNSNFFGTGYAKYAEAFYPLNELSASRWGKK
jgi:hypothetical protein